MFWASPALAATAGGANGGAAFVRIATDINGNPTADGYRHLAAITALPARIAIVF